MKKIKCLKLILLSIIPVSFSFVSFQPSKVISVNPPPVANYQNALYSPPNYQVDIMADQATKEALKAQNKRNNGIAYALLVYLKVKNPKTLTKLIKCESNGENVTRPDSDGYLSRGPLQFHDGPAGMETWNEMSRLSGIKGSPENIIDSIKMGDWMVSNGFLYRWSCAYITGMLKK